MTTKLKPKYFIIATIALFLTYLVIDGLFIRGRLVETYSGTVVKRWDNSQTVYRAGPRVFRATVKLTNGSFVDVVCQGFCNLDSEVLVEKYEPILGWNINYYAK